MSADKLLLGGKGYGLVEMTSLGLPVPRGFITTEVTTVAEVRGGVRVNFDVNAGGP